MQLDSSAVAAGVGLVALATIGSTNEEASARARNGERGPLWITAQAQTKGRGRLGRSWNSPPGNLYASLLLSEPSPIERAPELAFVTALALRDAIVAQAPALAPQLGFKWPNDLLLAGEKCAGILIEGEVWPGKTVSVVIGIGVNCAHHPPMASDHALAAATSARQQAAPFGENAVLFPATDLHAHGAEVTPEQLFTCLSATMCVRIAQWDSGRGFTGILGDWITSARGLGEDIRVRQGGSDKTGRFGGLDQMGRLVLEHPGGGVEKISAGDVFPFGLRRGRMMPSRRVK
ncbi:MAG: biotin--[acetyl-CoA-carboxylase] ligase [Xanthobacteraceae bacterium]|nr:biotin--[acetyl-CoA-carboxylase] ligase [Xanthobacteraceae bacterium]